ncbi:ABC transporter permease [Micromonospora sp. NBS 11-29]|uniref:ABC transporter permease n=1 Tax=Micromonospora sp. NBS 11-29 TaxID=1960879 RepID=UPI000B779FFE|nr:ABC transporter permease [Micromonospora sp. NBS 11-29]
MTAPTINGTRYPQPIEDLLPAARALDLPEGEAFPSRNRLMREFRIGAPKAGELLALLKAEPATLTADIAEPDATDPADPPAAPEPATSAEPDPTPAPEITPAEPPAEASAVSRPDTPTATAPARRAVAWPVVLLALPAFVAIWSGWVGLGGLTGFGIVHPLPGIWDSFSINSAITLPIGVETYGAYALYVWLSGRVPAPALRFAKWSALGSLVVGALGQVAYHLLEAAGVTSAPWWITTAVACLPVAVLGMGAALAHLVRTHD